MENWEIVGKTFLITGGASGLGALYAEEYLKEGAKKVAILDINEKQGITTAGRLNSIYPDKAIFIKCDVSVEAEIERAFNTAIQELTYIDVIINNAGIMNDSAEVWRKSCEVNVQGLISLTMKGVKHMRKDEGGNGGTIVNVASVAAIYRIRQLPIYCGTKMAVLHFSQSLAMPPFFEETGVRILTICFGPTHTPLLEDLLVKSYERKTGQEILELDEQSPHQKTESAVAACLKMFREGNNGSVWVSVNDKPGEDITQLVNEVYDKFQVVVFSGLL